MDRRNIVVGLDRSDSSLSAVRWAAYQSQLTGDRLVVLHSFEVEHPTPAGGSLRTATEAVHRSHATAWLRRALQGSPATPYSMRLHVVEGAWPDVLHRLANKSTSLVVLGRDAGPVSDLGDLGVPVVLVPGDTSGATDGGPREHERTPARRSKMTSASA